MKHLISFLIIMFSLHTLNAKEIHVSKTGKDSNAGTAASPYLTIQKAANIAASGDMVIIHKGIYREQVTVKTNNVTFTNFQNDMVVVSGADVVTGWTASSQGNGIYEAPFPGSETEYTMLFMNGARQEMARWPNNTTGEMMMPELKETGYEDCQVFTGTKGKKSRKAEFPNMSGFPKDHFKGGIFRGINGKKWINPMGIITASDGTDLTVDAITKGWIDNSEKIFTDNGKGFGFIFHLNALDREGEWFQKDNKVYFMPPAGTNPNDLTISTKNRKWAFVLNGRNGVKLQGIHIHAASLQMDGTDNAKIVDCSIQYLFPFLTRSGYAVSKTEQGGIYVKGDGNLFKNCYIAHSWGHGIYIDGGSGNRIENSTLEDLGWIAQFTSSLQNFGDGTVVTHSTFGSTGRFHIRTNGQIDILYNDLYDCMKMGQDAGSIQCTNGGNWGNPLNMKGSEIAYNRIHDCNTLTDGNKEFVLALYLEGCYNYTVHHNLIYNFITDVVPDGTFAYLGPRKAKITDCYYYNNTVWNVNYAVRVWNRDNEGDVENVRFWNNIIDGKAEYLETKGTRSLFALMSFDKNVDDITGNGNTLFVDAPNGDFRLKDGVKAIDYGKEISGITEGFAGSAPDAGAIEYGEEFPEVGSSLETNTFAFGDYLNGSVVITPDVSFNSLPSEYEQSTTFDITIDYVASEEQEIIALINAPDGTWLGNKKRVVQAGSGTETLTISLADIPAAGNGYKITCQIRPVGSAYGDAIDQEEKLVNIIGSYNDVIPLKKGWNLVGCPIEGSSQIETALASILDKIEIIKCFDEFYDAQDPTLSSLKYLQWGEGYFVKVSEDCELTWK